MIDWKRVLALHDEVGEAEFRPLVELFLDEIEGTLMTISAADPGVLEQRLLFLKGCAWNLGLRSFGAQCELWESLVLRGGADRFDRDHLLACYGDSKQMLMRDIDRLLSGGESNVA